MRREWGRILNECEMEEKHFPQSCLRRFLFSTLRWCVFVWMRIRLGEYMYINTTSSSEKGKTIAMWGWDGCESVRMNGEWPEMEKRKTKKKKIIFSFYFAYFVSIPLKKKKKLFLCLMIRQRWKLFQRTKGKDVWHMYKRLWKWAPRMLWHETFFFSLFFHSFLPSNENMHVCVF